MTWDPAGRVAVVTGAGSGIGRAIAKALGAAGASVALLGRRPEPLMQVASALDTAGAEALAVPCDITHPKQLKAGLGLVRASLGDPDLVINNAGAAHAGPLTRTSDEDIDRLMTLNVQAPFALVSELLPNMRERGYGRIVNIASTAALVGYRYTALYTATKHALAGWTRSLAADVLDAGITVNAVCPGFVDTDIVAQAAEQIAGKTGRSAKEARAELAGQNPIGRLVKPEEVAAAVLYLVGPHSGVISGHSLVLDGGTQPV